MMHSKPIPNFLLFSLVGGALLLSGCEGMMSRADREAAVEEEKQQLAQSFPALAAEFQTDSHGGWQGENPDTKESGPAKPEPKKVFPGTGQFVKKVTPEESAAAATGDVTLNFENTDIREVVKVVLTDLLNVSYIMDPGVRGGVTMQTGRPLSRDALLPTLETLLRMNGAAVVYSDGAYQVVPLAKAVKGTLTPQLGDAMTPLPAGYRVQIVPLKYIAAEEMNKILQPLVMEGSIVRVDGSRNLLLLAGTQRELQYMMETIETFDVDWIAGLSVGFFELKFTKTEDVLKDLNAILGTEGAESGMQNLLKVVPVESANGILVVSPRPQYLDQVSKWIERIDQMGGRGGAEPRLFVYRVRNGDAEKLGDMLNTVFGKESTRRSTTRSAQVAPGLKSKQTGTSGVGANRNRTSNLKDKNTEQQQQPVQEQPKQQAKSEGDEKKNENAPGQLADETRIVADPENNALLIMATPKDYYKIADVLQQLDMVPLQVLIEATIVEVVLNKSFELGVQWAFKGNMDSKRTETQLDTNKDPGLGKLLPGFSWALIDNADQIRVVLNAFADGGNVNVLSAPSVMVLDNHVASIQVGQQVPTKTGSESTGTGTGIISSIQYKDTGVMLSVKPRVNPGGLVTMEIEQEVSNVSEDGVTVDGSTSFNTRNISSTVAVQSGQAVVLGGLIRDEQSYAKGGVPYLHEVPVAGYLFGEESKTNRRTELVVIITPRVVGSDRDARKITDDFRAKLQGLHGRF